MRLLPAIVLGLVSQLPGQDHELLLWPDGVPGAPSSVPAPVVSGRGDGTHKNRFIRDVHVPKLTVYLPPAATNTGTAIVICPGGGYAGLAIDKEGHDIARWLNTIGVAGLVLEYRMPRPKGHVYGHEAPLADARRAMTLAREHAGEWRIEPRRIGMMGFSAGGHLAATTGTQFDKAVNRPDFLVLVYPVISMVDGITHRSSRRNLLGESPSPELIRRFSAEQQVDYLTPPSFLVSTSDDPIKVENSIAFYKAVKDAGIPAELHVYEHGGHGYGILPRRQPVSSWHHRLKDWLADRGLLTPEKPAAERLRLYLLIGQSNMAGRGRISDEDRRAHPRVFTFAKDNRWVPARDPIHFDKPIAGVGLGRTFGIEMAELAPKARIGLIPCAVGGSSIRAWTHGGYHKGTKTHPYDDMLRRVRLAVRDGDLAGILWHQGESDSQAIGPARRYHDRLVRLIQDLRRDLQEPGIPILLGELGPWRTNEPSKIVNAALARVASEMPGVGFVSARGTRNKAEDKGHFDSESLHELGRRYARAWQEVRGRERR